MSSWWYAVDVNKGKDDLNPLLPHIAGLIENIGEATFSVIKGEVERELERDLTDVDVTKALECGIKLGVLREHREFKVCREFTTKEIKRAKMCPEFRLDDLNTSLTLNPVQERNLYKYVKSQRERRRNKMHKKGKKARTSLSSKFMKGGNIRLYKYLCTKCKRSVEREIQDQLASGTSSDDEEGQDSPTLASGKSSSSCNNSHLGYKFSEDVEKPPKSRLLVEKNPMETDPPYCDIFT